MKSISDILSSMVQPTEQNNLFSSTTAASNQGNSQTGSFGDVLSRLTAQNDSQANALSANAQNAGTGTTAQGKTGFSAAQIEVTDVQVQETLQTTDANSAALKQVEATVASMAAALTQLVQLASNLQNMNAQQAQQLLVQAGGGAISASQAQQLVSQLAAYQASQSGQNPLGLNAAQQGALVGQLLQNMLQNQQITVTPVTVNANTQSVSGASSQSAALQFNFTDNNNDGTTVESLAVNIQTLDLQVSSQTQNAAANNNASSNLTDATTQRLTQLLQQLNVTPSSTPTQVQVQSSVASTPSQNLADNFKNLVQILTQAGAGQAVLQVSLRQGNQQGNPNQTQPSQANSVTANTQVVSNSTNTVNLASNVQILSESALQNPNQTAGLTGQNTVLQDIQVQTTETQLSFIGNGAQNTAVSGQASANSSVQASVLNTPVTQVAPNQGASLGTSLSQNQTKPQVIQNPNNGNGMTPGPEMPPVIANPIPGNGMTPGPVLPPSNGAGTAAGSTQVFAQPQTTQTGPVSSVGVQPAAPVNGSAVTSSQAQPQTKVAEQLLAQTPVQTVTAQNQPSAPAVQAPVVSDVASVPQTQPNNTSAPVAQTATVPATTAVTPNQAVSNATSDIITATYVQAQVPQDQDNLVLSNGQLDALNTLVARFNSGVVQAGPTGPNTNTLNGNTQVYETVTGQQGNATTSINTVLPQAAQPVENTPTSANLNVLTQQDTQQTNSTTTANIQTQLTQPVSPTQQQPANVINTAAQNAFVPTAANTTASGNSNTTVQPTVPVIPTQTQPVVNTPTAASNPVQPVTASNQVTTQVSVPTSESANPVTVNVQAPVVTQPVVNPASPTAQNVQASTAAGEAVKSAIVTPTPANAPVASNAPVVAEVSAVQAVQPITSQAVTQTPATTQNETSLSVSVNASKDNLADTTDLQNALASTANSSVASTASKTTNSFQSTVNSVSTPNGSVDSAQILSQISQQVQAQANDAKMVSRLNFQLVPESLGRVTVQVALVDQSVSARIVVTNPDVREVLQQHMVDLKAALSQAGLQIDQMQVQVQGGGANLLAQYYQYQQEGNSYRGSAWTPTTGTDEALNTDNSTVSTPVLTNRLVNILA